MHNQRYPQIDRQTIDTYQTDGVVLLKGAFTAWIDGLANGVAELMANPSEYGHARTVVPKDGSAPFFQDYCNWSRIADFEQFVRQSPAAEIAAALMQSTTAKFFHEHTLVKPAGGSTVTPGITISPTTALRGGRTSAFGSRWTRLRRRFRCAASAAPTCGERSSVRPASTARSSISTVALRSCRTLTPIRRSTISSAGRWSRATRSPSTIERCTAPEVTPRRGRDGSSPPAGWATTRPLLTSGA